jgi:hypothetical protein
MIAMVAMTSRTPPADHRYLARSRVAEGTDAAKEANQKLPNSRDLKMVLAAQRRISGTPARSRTSTHCSQGSRMIASSTSRSRK